jgi:hypothetical protein
MSSAQDVLVREPEFATRRWRKRGRDRMYVRVGGVDVGYRDLNSGEVICPNEEHRELVQRATYVPRHAAPERTG